MTLTEQVFAQAALLAGELDGRQTNLLRLLCGASASSLTARLREGLTPEDCKADFIAAASLLALAQLNGGATSFKSVGNAAAFANMRELVRQMERAGFRAEHIQRSVWGIIGNRIKQGL